MTLARISMLILALALLAFAYVLGAKPMAILCALAAGVVGTAGILLETTEND